MQRRINTQPDLQQCVLLLTESRKQGDFVRYSNQLARRRGVQIGMPISEAQTFAQARDRLVVEEIQPIEDRQALVDIALRCERFSFRIGIEESDIAESILMDVTGIAHFFSGEEALADQLNQAVTSRHYMGHVAIGDTIGAAWAAAHYLAEPNRPVVIPSGEVRPLHALPLPALRLSEPLLRKLLRLGITTIRQVLTLDRASLARRLGHEILTRLDQLTGQFPETITPCHPLPQYRARKTLEEGITHPDAIEQLVSLLLKRILDMLAPKRLGTRYLACRFALENRATQTLDLRLCETTSDPQHIRELMRIHLEKLRLSSPAIGLEIEALEVAPLGASQEEFLEGMTRDRSRQLSILLNRFSSRLGEQAVVAPSLFPDPIPERSVELVSVTGTSLSTSTLQGSRFHGLDRPTALFLKPRPVEVIASIPDGPPVVLFWKQRRIEIIDCSEPERIETGWWQGEYVCRDYYRVETTDGEWLWVFRRLQDSRWFWHGEWF